MYVFILFNTKNYKERKTKKVHFPLNALDLKKSKVRHAHVWKIQTVQNMKTKKQKHPPL